MILSKLWALEGWPGLLALTPHAPPLQLTYLPQPWGNCRAESELREPELQGYSAYSVSACRLRCEKEAVLQRCHCRMVHMPGRHPTPAAPLCHFPRLQNLWGWRGVLWHLQVYYMYLSLKAM